MSCYFINLAAEIEPKASKEDVKLAAETEPKTSEELAVEMRQGRQICCIDLGRKTTRKMKIYGFSQIFLSFYVGLLHS